MKSPVTAPSSTLKHASIPLDKYVSFFASHLVLDFPVKGRGDKEEKTRVKILKASLTRWGNKAAIDRTDRGSEAGHHISTWRRKKEADDTMPNNSHCQS